MKFAIIAALDSQRGIGRHGRLPWHLGGDLDHFKKLTIGRGHNAVIMGRVTWLSLPEQFKPLPQRLNVVLSKQPQKMPAGVLQAASLDEALSLPAVTNCDQVWVIGGARVYEHAITHPDCQKIYLTEIEGQFSCDTFFPPLPTNFVKVSLSEPLCENSITYRFAVYEKKEK